MKRIMGIVGLLALCVSAGCANFHAKGAMATAIDGNAMLARANIAKVGAGTLDDDGAKDALGLYRAAFVAYAGAKTTNPFAYWFGDKTILVDGEYATRLDRAAVLAAETAERSETAAAPWLQQAVVRESKVLLDVKAAKDGKESEP